MGQTASKQRNNQESTVELYLNPVRQRLLRSIFGLVVGQKNLHLFESLDWEAESDRIRNPTVIYPDYYTRPAFHGIAGGYLTEVAAVTYDAVTAIATPPRESWVRHQLLKSVVRSPHRILDLGCGTGSTTLLLKQAFPEAYVMGLDLSPYMLVLAHAKAQQIGVEIDWQHGLAEATGLESESFDIVTTSFLFHETPPAVAQAILREGFRLTRSNGQVLILDGSQPKLRHLGWLIQLFREPYSAVYANGCVDDWATAAGFERVETQSIGWIHQLTSGTKPSLRPGVPQR